MSGFSSVVATVVLLAVATGMVVSLNNKEGKTGEVFGWQRENYLRLDATRKNVDQRPKKWENNRKARSSQKKGKKGRGVKLLEERQEAADNATARKVWGVNLGWYMFPMLPHSMFGYFVLNGKIVRMQELMFGQCCGIFKPYPGRGLNIREHA
ncbi:hypothetical protein JHK84_052130 [Glycine max]|nr:hypothetical protein JHK86_052083 [Glycine max]KAG5082092.1 hypothetical protein JHK84_052130 [Glycine max]